MISGTSMDGVSAVLADFDRTQNYVVGTYGQPYPDALRAELEALCGGTDNEIDRMGKADKQLGMLFADAVLVLLKNTGIDARQVRAIGSHGQTIRHRPKGNYSFSIQIADANIIAARSGIPVVADLRRKDMACGGEGAPLAPAFHAHVFGQANTRRFIVNIGGISNISVLENHQAIAGYDCGAGNIILDGWCTKNLGKAYDDQGQWARSGKVDTGLLSILQTHPFLCKPLDKPPLSTGREEFNMQWLAECLNRTRNNIAPEDVQATVLELTATCIAKAFALYTDHHNIDKTIYVCGGGAYNLYLMERLTALVAPMGFDVKNTEPLGVKPEWVEGLAFAWFAMRHQQGKPSNVPELSGADRECVLGCLYPS